MAVTRRQVNIYIEGKQAGETIRSLYTERRKLTAAVEAGTLSEQEYISAVNRLRTINSTISDHRRALTGVESTWDKLKAAGGRFVGFAAAAFTAGAVVEYGKQLFNVGVQMEVLTKKAATVFGQALPQVTAAAEKNAEAMGLTTAQYINAAAAIGDLLIPMGFQRQEAADMSTELVNLSGALSEWTGGQIASTDVSKILSKALLGEREELKQLGIAISDADVKARLAKKGLEDLTGQALEQAKAMATLELITEKSGDAQTAFANNSDTAVRRQAELSAKIREITERLATLLLPVFERLVGIADNVVGFFSDLTKGIEGVVDPAKAAVEAFNEQKAVVAGLENDLGPLLDRYDELTGKSNLSAEEQEELRKIIVRVGEAVPSSIQQFDAYGKALSINSDRAREFIETQKAILKVQNADAIRETEKALQGVYKQYGLLDATLNGLPFAYEGVVKKGDEFFRRVQGQGLNAGIVFEKLTEDELGGLQGKLGELNTEILGLSGILKQLSGEEISIGEVAVDDNNETDTGGGGGDDKAIKELEKRQEKIRDMVKQFEEEQRLAALDEDDRKIEQLRLRYQKEIDLAKELEAKNVQGATEQRIELERLQAEALSQLRQEIADERLEKELELQAEALVKLDEEKKRFQEEKAEAEQQNQEFIREAVLDEQANALAELEAHYMELLALSEKYGIDTLDLEIAYRRQQAKVRKEFQEKTVKDTVELQKKEAEALAKTYQGLANIVSGVLEFVTDESTEFSAASKILALVQIGLKSAEAIAAATAASAGVPFPGNLAAIGTAVATVLGNMAQARRILNATPEVQQKAEGGYYGVRGKNDGRTYRAKYIGQPLTGMLPGYPVLINSASGGPVLASEAGAEYFVSSTALKDPRVFNYVRAIDNIARTRQYQDGGFTAEAPTLLQAPPTSTDTGMTQALSRMNTLLELMLTQGVIARIDDDFVIDLRKKQQQLLTASGN